jgi:hypothetical protein
MSGYEHVGVGAGTAGCVLAAQPIRPHRGAVMRIAINGAGKHTTLSRWLTGLGHDVRVAHRGGRLAP